MLLLAGLRLCFCRRIRGTELERGRHQNATSCFKRRCFVYVSVNILTTEEIHTFTSDDEDMEMVEHFGDLGSVIQSDGDGSDARLGKTAKSKDVSQRPGLRPPTPALSRLPRADAKGDSEEGRWEDGGLVCSAALVDGSVDTPRRRANQSDQSPGSS